MMHVEYAKKSDMDAPHPEECLDDTVAGRRWTQVSFGFPQVLILNRQGSLQQYCMSCVMDSGDSQFSF